MRAVITGAGGFIGQALVRQLRARGDEVVAVVRTPDSPAAVQLREQGCEIAAIDLAGTDDGALGTALAGADALFHLAGWYRVGIPPSQHTLMYRANVVATERVLDAGIAAGVTRIVHASTGNVFGDTRGRVVDETYRRPQPPHFLSYYDETKYLAHLAAEARIEVGAPILIAYIAMVYGPGDHSQVGATLGEAMAGRQPFVSAGSLGGSFVHVDDVAAGLLLIHDRGEIGEAYALGGEIATLGEVARRAAAIGGHRAPLAMPDWAVQASVPFAPLMSRVLTSEPDLGEQVRSSVGVTYWVSDAKARSQLGYAPRDLEAGLPTLREA